MYRIFDVIYERRTLLGISYFLAYNKPSNAIQIGLLETNSETNNQRSKFNNFSNRYSELWIKVLIIAIQKDGKKERQLFLYSPKIGQQ